MNSRVTFTIPGRIGGKGRHRSFLRAGAVIHAADRKTVNQEAVVRQIGALAMRGKSPFAGAVSLHVTVWRTPPRSWSRSRQERTHFVTGKPDCDNVVKLVADALNGITWKDDAQIAVLSFMRLYVTHESERVNILVEDLEGVDGREIKK